MKKFFNVVSVLSLFVLMACQQPTDPAVNNGNVSKWGSLEAKAIYSTFLGTWQLKEGQTLKTNGFVPVIFASDSITLGTTRYTINQDTDLIKSKDYDGPSYLNGTDCFGEIYIKLSDRLLAIDTTGQYNDLDACIVYWNMYENLNRNWLNKVSGSTSGGEEDVASVNGTYAFNSATGSQSNGTITLSDGNFSYNGNRSQAPSSGTYTVNGSDITFSWTANGYSVSTTVTVSKDGSSVILSSSEVLFFSTFFGSTAQSGGKYTLTFNYTE